MTAHKRQRVDESLFLSALKVLLARQSDAVAGHDMQSALVSLLETSRATRRVLVQWMRTRLTHDVTRGHEPTAIPVHNVPPQSSQLLLLLKFRYATRVEIPVPPSRHALSLSECDRLRRERADVARVLGGCRVQMYARFTEATGWGVYAARCIESNEYVGEYTGELLSSAEARRRHRDAYDRCKMNYVLALRERLSDGRVVRTNVDATSFGSYARFFNHSCAPTLRLEAVRVDSVVPRLVFFTQRAVETGEELTFDYGDGGGSGDTAIETDAEAPTICHCYAPCCRGAMPFDSSL